MHNAKRTTRLLGAVSIAMTTLFWLFYWLPPNKVDSFLQSLPLLAPLSWIEVWLMVALGLGIWACARRWRVWLVAPLFTVTTAAVFFVRILD